MTDAEYFNNIANCMRAGDGKGAISVISRIRAEARAETIEECIDYLADCDLIGHDGAWAQSIRSNLLSEPKRTRGPRRAKHAKSGSGCYARRGPWRIRPRGGPKKVTSILTLWTCKGDKRMKLAKDSDEAQKIQDAKTGEPHAWIQWKGTDVCMDVYCHCGAWFHVDAQFAYHVKCPACGAVYYCNGHIELIKIENEPPACLVTAENWYE